MHVLGCNIKYISYRWDESLRKSPDNLNKVQENGPSLGPRDAKARPLEPNAGYPGKSEPSLPLVKAKGLYPGASRDDTSWP